MFQITLSYIRQFEDTTEIGADEPYVIVFAADLADTGLIPVPAALSTLYGPYEMGSVVGFPPPVKLCWGFNGQPRNIDDADNPLILVALMESDHDDSPPDFANAVRVGSHGMLTASLLGYVTALNQGTMDLATLRKQMIDDMQGAVDIFKSIDIEKDERLGPVQLLEITNADLTNAQNDVVKKKLTFRSREEDSHYELTFSIATGVGTSSSALTSSGPTDRYAAIWVKESGAPWVARHRMTASKYQQEFDELTKKGYRLIHVSGYNYGGQPHFAAIWDKSEGPAWVARHNMTSEKYQDEFNKLVRRGYRLTQVSGYRGDGQDLYAAIWTMESDSAWVARHRMTSDEYQKEFDKFVQDGYRLTDVSGYEIAGKARYAAIWDKSKKDCSWVARHGMSSTQYQKEFNKLVKEGYHLIQVSGYNVGGKHRFAAIWDKCKHPAWVARHNMTSEGYQKEFDKYVEQGYRLVCVSGY